jgi:hypothetical protein
VSPQGLYPEKSRERIMNGQLMFVRIEYPWVQVRSLVLKGIRANDLENLITSVRRNAIFCLSCFAWENYCSCPWQACRSCEVANHHRLTLGSVPASKGTCRTRGQAPFNLRPKADSSSQIEQSAEQWTCCGVHPEDQPRTPRDPTQ